MGGGDLICPESPSLIDSKVEYPPKSLPTQTNADHISYAGKETTGSQDVKSIKEKSSDSKRLDRNQGWSEKIRYITHLTLESESLLWSALNAMTTGPSIPSSGVFACTA